MPAKVTKKSTVATVSTVPTVAITKAEPTKTKAPRLSEADKALDPLNYIKNPHSGLYVLRSSADGKKYAKAEETGVEVPKTMTETERLLLVISTLQNHFGLADEEIKKALQADEAVLAELPRGFPAGWGGKKKTARSPDHPKQASNPYIWFVKATREDIAKANPGVSPSEVMKMMGELWQNTKEEDRIEYVEAAEADKARYDSEMAVYYVNHPDEVPTKSTPGSDKPKKENAYHLFTEHHRAAVYKEYEDAGIDTNGKGKEITKKLADMWADVKKNDKALEQKFQDLADAANVGFEDRVIEYYNSPGEKKLSPAELKKSMDPNYEIDPKTGRYNLKPKEKKVVEKKDTKKSTVKKPTAKKPAVVKKPVEAVEPDTQEVGDEDGDLLCD
jgi:hypothetical protein